MEVTPEIKQKIDELQDMFGPEELIPELKMCLTRRKMSSGAMVTCLMNEFVVDVFYHDALNKNLNGRYRQQKARAEQAERDKDWDMVLFLRERPFRFDAFVRFCWQMDDASYWKCLRSIWVDAENPGVNRRHWLRFFTDPNRTGREEMMETEEKDYLVEQPDPLTIYRGAEPRYKKGLSWTTNKERAAWFARRFDRGGKVYVATVCKKDVIAYFNSRNEDEILVDPKKLKIKLLDNETVV